MGASEPSSNVEGPLVEQGVLGRAPPGRLSRTEKRRVLALPGVHSQWPMSGAAARTISAQLSSPQV